MLNPVEIPNDGYTVAIGNTPNATEKKSFSVVSLINAIKLDAIKSYQGILTVNNSSLSSFINTGNGVDKSSSAFNNAGIKPKSSAQTDYSMYYIGGGIGIFLLILTIIFIARKS